MKGRGDASTLYPVRHGPPAGAAAAQARRWRRVGFWTVLGGTAALLLGAIVSLWPDLRA